MSGQASQDQVSVVTDLQSAKKFARDTIASPNFDIGIGIIILINSAMISAEQALEVSGHDTLAFKVLDSFFLVIYIGELSLRVFSEGFMKCARDHWVKFDVFLVLLGVVSAWILDPVMGGSQLGPVMVLRMARLFRVVKTARMFRRKPEFWMLIRGIINSFNIMIYVMVVLIVFLYIFASVAIELITKNEKNMGPNPDPVFQEQVEKHFRNLPMAMLTLLRFVCMDSMSEIYLPLIERDPWLAAYFIVIVLTTGILIMNLISAVIFVSVLEENHLEHETAQKNMEDSWTQLVRDLKGVFLRLDCERTGKLNAQMMSQLNEEDRSLLAHTLDLDVAAKPLKIFQKMDRFKRGDVTINEFYDAVADTAMNRGEITMKRMERQFEKMYWRQKDIFDIQQEEHMARKTLYDNVSEINALLKGSNLVQSEGSSVQPKGMKMPHIAINFDEKSNGLHEKSNALHDKINGLSRKSNGVHDNPLSHALGKASELFDIINTWDMSMRRAMDALTEFQQTVQNGASPEPKRIMPIKLQQGNKNPPKKQSMEDAKAPPPRKTPAT